jgi:hypothetical protein
MSVQEVSVAYLICKYLKRVCAVLRQRFSVCPIRQPLQPEEIGSVMERWLRPLFSLCARFHCNLLCPAKIILAAAELRYRLYMD